MVLSAALLTVSGLGMAACASPGSSVNTTSASSAELAAPAGVTTSAGGEPAPALQDCTAGALATLTPGTLLVGTASPTAEPWFIGDSPSDGEGLESSVAYAVAQALGYGPDQVAWEVVDRAAAMAGTSTGFDINLNQFTAPDAGSASADYSTGYFSVTETLITRSPKTTVTSADLALQGLSVGAVAGSSGAAAAQSVDGSKTVPFADQQLALAALAAGSVEGVVLSTPAALAAAVADPELALVGQLPSDPEIQPEQFKVLLPKGSALTGCVSAAIDRLRVEGTLEDLAAQWVEPLAPPLS